MGHYLFEYIFLLSHSGLIILLGFLTPVGMDAAMFSGQIYN